MKKIAACIVLFATMLASYPQEHQSQQTGYGQKMAWWREAKFGMFIHWGPYAIYGGVYRGHNQNRGGAEWIMNRCKIPVGVYQEAAKTFNPVNYDAEAWVKLAKEAGMKYIVITSKHHDGFAMFKSNASKFNIVDWTDCKKDVLDELAKACRKHDMKLGFYYSQAQDWNNPGGAVARKLMREGWNNPDSITIDAYTAKHAGSWDPAQQTATMEEYMRKVSIPQVKELLSNYGDVAVLWWDTPVGMTDKFASELSGLLAEHPQIITNDRLKRPNFLGDYKTPEGRVPKAEDIEGVDWETCMNIGSSWGYKSWENSWKSSKTLVRTLAAIAARGGNYLLNVGPDATGLIPPEAVARLKDIGRWMNVNGEAIYGTQRSLLYPSWGECTRKDLKNNSVLYLCVFDWPTDGKLSLETSYKVSKASLLCNNRKLKITKTAGSVMIDVPADVPDTIASVIRLELSEKLPPVKIVSNTQKAFEIVDEL
ncbi:MAG: alpha-L-fucosidase [Prevotella sp.]|jgi:alpha-L-fucosidase|nr:alpha-L-fucosidase [Prevotella sp.]